LASTYKPVGTNTCPELSGELLGIQRYQQKGQCTNPHSQKRERPMPKFRVRSHRRRAMLDTLLEKFPLNIGSRPNRRAAPLIIGGFLLAPAVFMLMSALHHHHPIPGNRQIPRPIK
jgi:hypothetical protein